MKTNHLIGSADEDGVNFGSSEGNQSSILNNKDLVVQKKNFAFEEALKNSAGLYPLVSLWVIYLVSIATILTTFYFISNNVTTLTQ